jgi:hypothetical protein
MVHCLTSFTVLENYKEFKDEKGFVRWIVNLEPEHQLDAKFKAKNIYNPLEEARELYMELNKVNFKDPETLTKFVATYGLPLGENIEAGNKENKVFYKMDVFDFIEKLVRFKEIMRIWQAIKENNHEVLEKTKKTFHLLSAKGLIEMSEEYMDYVIKNKVEILEFFNSNTPFSDEDFKLWNSVKDLGLQDIALAYIKLLFRKQYFGKMDTDLVDVPRNKNGKITMKKTLVDAVSFNDLFEVAFYQLRQLIFNEQEIRYCEHCKFPFEVTHEKQRFCPSVLGKKRSNCENTHNQRIRRQRKKEIE